MSTPIAIVGTKFSTITEKVTPGVSISYIDDPFTANLICSTGESGVSLVMASWDIDTTVQYGERTYCGKIISRDDKLVTIQTSDSVVVTKYDSISQINGPYLPHTYRVIFQDLEEPELRYMTKSIWWRPMMTIDIDNNLFSVSAIVQSSRLGCFEAMYTIILDSPEDYRRPISYDIGLLTLGLTYRHPLYERSTTFYPFNFIKLDLGKKSKDKIRTMYGYLLRCPFNFPKGDGVILERNLTKPHQFAAGTIGELMAIEIYHNEDITYRYTVFSQQGKMIVTIIIDKRHKGKEDIYIMLPTDGLKIIYKDVMPVLSDEQISGYLCWRSTIKTSTSKLVLTIPYAE